MRRSIGVYAGLFAMLAVMGGLAALVLLRQLSPPAEPVMVRYESTKRALEALVTTEGPRVALDRLAIIAAADTELAGLCHGLSHEVGHAAQEILGFTGALAMQDDVCGSGYVHGVIEHEMSDHIDDFERSMKTLCPPDDPRCFHGLGHGLMYVTRNNLPRSLQQCRTFTVPFQRIQCDEGVFMENFEADAVVHPSAYLYPDEPYRTCSDQPEPEKGVCTFYFPRYFLQVHPDEYADLLSFCQTLPTKSAEACLKGAGSAAMKASVLEPRKALQICELLPQDQQSFCVAGLLSYMIVHYASTVPAENFCKENLMPRWSDICTRSLLEGGQAYSE